jgi:hypothetical protein
MISKLGGSAPSIHDKGKGKGKGGKPPAKTAEEGREEEEEGEENTGPAQVVKGQVLQAGAYTRPLLSST